VGKVNEFKREFGERAGAIEGVEEIEWLGSMADTFVQGTSDLDLVIRGSVSAKGKEKVSSIIKELNYKYALGLETAPYQHPTPFYVDNPAKEVGYDLLVSKGGLAIFEGIRKIWKHHAPTYGQVWELEERTRKMAPGLLGVVRRLLP